MIAPKPLPRANSLAPYTPGLSVAAIRETYGVENVVKLASNENPLGASPLAREALARAAAEVFRYPRGGNPELVSALAAAVAVPESRLVVGNGSDEIIDLLTRIMAEAGRHNMLCFDPCFAIYPIQAQIAGVETRRAPLKPDFSFDFDALLNLADENTRLAFITTPDNPSGYAPPREEVEKFAARLARRAPKALLVIDEAYADFAPDEKAVSLLAAGNLPPNVAFLRTMSKSYGLAGARIGFAVLPANVADAFRRARLPFSVNILAERCALAALRDAAFREATLKTVSDGRRRLTEALLNLGCRVWPSSANFLMFQLPEGADPDTIFNELLKNGVIIRSLKSYGLPEYFRVSVGSPRENGVFRAALARALKNGLPARD